MEFRILGPLEVWTDDGRRARTEGAKQERMLGTLLLNAGAVVPVTRLVDAVWGDEPPATARRQVRNLAGLLRRKLAAAQDGPPVLLTDGPGYRIAPNGHRVDALTFAHRVSVARRLAECDEPAAAVAEFRAALGLWRGPVLDGLSGGLPAAGSVALNELRLTAWENCLDLEAELGRHRQIVPELTALVAEHPLRDRFVTQLVRALHRAGRQADGLAAYRRFARQLADELGLDPGPELRLLHQELLKDGPAPAAHPPRTRQSPRHSHPVPRPAQLPPALATFVGRRAELGALDGLVGPAGPTGSSGPAGPARPAAAVGIGVLTGGAGTGKTALAVHWAHRVRERFPDGQLHIDLRGYALGPPLAPYEALSRFLRALGTDRDRIPGTIDESAALYRSLLADRRVLVLLDNARNAEQVRPLLPGSVGSLTLVTGRDGLAGLTARDGARRLVLDVLPPPEAVELLARITGADRTRAEPHAAAELAAACGHLPLALGIAAGRLAERPHRTLVEHAAELRNAEDRLTALQIDGDTTSAVRLAFDLSYRALRPTAQRLFRLLGLAPGATISAAAAAALSGSAPAATRPVLEELVAAHLLNPAGPDHYRLPDLVRCYAAERAGAETGPAHRAAARARLCSWYLHRTEAAARLLAPRRPCLPLSAPGPWYEPPGFTTPAQARQWCEREYAHLSETVRRAAEHGFDGRAWRLPVALWRHFRAGPDLADWTEAARSAVAAARRTGDPAGEAHARDDPAAAPSARGRQVGPALDPARPGVR
ncbi:DNA-binding transcriptional activator of the SARP family [Streptomyces sp. TLI_053]|uniref:AfsR/SARP family transcriptional regulator n=1 Tax=Streptomyces sp. TLI_053 TaxID=1855352 RepID=UPI00087B8196|nr:BTAD domain-containing putative transcriptional regulator [Streptomyces sp. TLI_053]SDS88687.1 DNA-binding transcriptional activator of the SARP family [Streptomyces sp. TLI_053]